VKYRGWETPWSRRKISYKCFRYDRAELDGFSSDLCAAQEICRLAGLAVGSIDFIKDKIHEINGGGTTFTEYHKSQCVADARPPLVQYFVDLLHKLA
jgi:hypothetical protein